jgi:N-formylglutamate deformylase
MIFPADFRPAASYAALQTTWDAYVDELWSDAPDAGATLLTATFPRAYVDVNRAESDIDETLLGEPWPVPLTPTDYTKRGMGLIRRNALPDVPMYDRALTVAEVEHRITTYYRPYRDALRGALDVAHARSGLVFHVDCHSMKSRGNAMNVDNGAERPDLVISDRHGTTADSTHTTWACEWFRARGYTVQMNDPYQGGDLVRTFGNPREGRHSMQIEINRARYMNEAAFTRSAEFAAMRESCAQFVRALADRARGVTR